jgi:hypothetical protein
MAKKKQYITGKLNPSRHLFKKVLRNKLFWIITVIIIVVIAGLIVWHKKSSNKTTSHANTELCNKSENSPIYSQAASVLDQSKIKDLAKVVDKIKSQRNYQSDPNCLYPVVVYYSYNYDYQNAKKYYDMLQKVYDSKKGFAKVYDAYYNMHALKSIVDHIKKSQSETEAQFNRGY